MASLNRCEFIGNLGKDVEIRYTNDGKAVAGFSIACSESWKDKSTGEKKEKTEWINVSAFGKLAEIMGEYLKKGSKVFVAGKMTTDKYTDKQGVEKYSTKIIANEMVMLDSKEMNQQSANRQQHAAAQQGQPNHLSKPKSDNKAPPINNDFDDDIPF